MRIIKRKAVVLKAEQMLLEARASRWVSVGLGLAGAAIIALDHLMRPREAFAAAAALVIWAALGAVAVGCVLFFYRQSILIDIGRGIVVIRERLFFPLRTVQRHLDEFDSVRAESVFSTTGRGTLAAAPFFTITLVGQRYRIALFDVDDYGEAVEAARKLSSYLGLPGEAAEG